MAAYLEDLPVSDGLVHVGAMNDDLVADLCAHAVASLVVIALSDQRSCWMPPVLSRWWAPLLQAGATHGGQWRLADDLHGVVLCVRQYLAQEGAVNATIDVHVACADWATNVATVNR